MMNNIMEIGGAPQDIDILLQLARRLDCMIVGPNFPLVEKPATMGDEEIVEPLRDGCALYGYRDGTRSVMSIPHRPETISDYSVFATAEEAKKSHHREVIRRKADLVRKRILEDAGYVDDGEPMIIYYTAQYTEGEWRPRMINRALGMLFPWYFFPSQETCDRFFRIMGTELRELM